MQRARASRHVAGPITERSDKSIRGALLALGRGEEGRTPMGRDVLSRPGASTRVHLAGFYFFYFFQFFLDSTERCTIVRIHDVPETGRGDNKN